MQQRTIPTCRSPYPGGPWRLHVSVLRHHAAAFLPLARSQRPRLALSRPAQDSLALRPTGLLGAPCAPYVSEASARAVAHSRRPDSYRAVPTRARVGLAPTGSLCPPWHTLTFALSRGAQPAPRSAVGSSAMLYRVPANHPPNPLPLRPLGFTLVGVRRECSTSAAPAVLQLSLRYVMRRSTHDPMGR